MNYWDCATHRLLIRDINRTNAFSRAIADTVKAGDIVLDVGAGVGILSMLAAKAGAARVYAVERTGIAAMATQLIQANGLADRVFVQQCDVRCARLPERVDVLISEWMGTIGVDENMYGAVLWARDHWMKPNGRIIPALVTAWVAPVGTDMRPDVAFFRSRPYGLDLSALSETSIHELLTIRRSIQSSNLTAQEQMLWTSNAHLDTPASVLGPYSANLRFPIERPGQVSALAAWFTSELAPTTNLSNAPDAPNTHWGQLMLPLDREVTVAPGDIIEAHISAWPVDSGPLQMAWACRINAGPWEYHDTSARSQTPSLSMEMNATDELPFSTQRSELSAFLADLALSPDLLAEFLEDSDGVLLRHKISPLLKAALKSRDPYQIQNALYAAGNKS